MNTLRRVSGPARDGGEIARDGGEIARDGGEIARDEAGANSARGAGCEAARDSDEVELPEMLRDFGRAMQVSVGLCWE